MFRHFHEELKDLKDQLVLMGQAVVHAIEKSVRSLFQRDNRLAHEVIDSDERAVNQFEIEIDEKVRSLSALQQPAANDMRLLASIYKMNTDLERMGDHAVNIAERALLLNEQPPLETDIHLKDLAVAAQKMLQDALYAFVREDAALAREVLKRDDEVDAYNDALYSQIVKMIEKDPQITRTGMNLVMVSHNLERIADLANNIAEDVIYMKQGKEVRHHLG